MAMWIVLFCIVRVHISGIIDVESSKAVALAWTRPHDRCRDASRSAFPPAPARRAGLHTKGVGANRSRISLARWVSDICHTQTVRKYPLYLPQSTRLITERIPSVRNVPHSSRCANDRCSQCAKDRCSRLIARLDAIEHKMERTQSRKESRRSIAPLRKIVRVPVTAWTTHHKTRWGREQRITVLELFPIRLTYPSRLSPAAVAPLPRHSPHTKWNSG